MAAPEQETTVATPPGDGAGISRRELLTRGGRAALAVGALSGVAGIGARASSAAGASPIKVGVLVPLSGGYEVYGSQALRAAQLVASQVNEKGGIRVGKTTRPVKLIVEDTTNQPTVALQKLKKLALQDRVSFIVGPQSSAERAAVIDFAMKVKMPLLYYIVYEGGACDKYLYGLGPTPSTSIQPYMKWLVKNHGKRIYFTGWDYNANQIIGDGFKEWILAAGGVYLGQNLVPFSTTDFAPQLRKAQAAKPDIVFNGMYGATGFIELFAQLGMNKKAHLTGWAFDRAQLQALSKPAAVNLSWCADWEDTTKPIAAPGNAPFLKAMHDMFGTDKPVTNSASDTFVGFHMYAQAIEAAGTLDPDAVSVKMDGRSFQGPGGKYTLSGDNHNMNMPAYVFVSGGPKNPYEIRVAANLGQRAALPTCGRKWQHS